MASLTRWTRVRKLWETVEDRGAWRAAVHGITETRTRLGDGRTAISKSRRSNEGRSNLSVIRSRANPKGKRSTQWKQPPQGVDALERLCSEGRNPHSSGSTGFQRGLTNPVGWSRDQALPWLSPGPTAVPRHHCRNLGKIPCRERSSANSHQLEVKAEPLKRKKIKFYLMILVRVSLLPEGRAKTSAPINE